MPLSLAIFAVDSWGRIGGRAATAPGGVTWSSNCPAATSPLPPFQTYAVVGVVVLPAFAVLPVDVPAFVDFGAAVFGDVRRRDPTEDATLPAAPTGAPPPPPALPPLLGAAVGVLVDPIVVPRRKRRAEA